LEGLNSLRKFTSQGTCSHIHSKACLGNKCCFWNSVDDINCCFSNVSDVIPAQTTCCLIRLVFVPKETGGVKGDENGNANLLLLISPVGGFHKPKRKSCKATQYLALKGWSYKIFYVFFPTNIISRQCPTEINSGRKWYHLIVLF
jgi:hypothetical protein